MRDYGELSITGDPEALAATLRRIEESLTDSWKRDTETEGRMVQRVVRPGVRYCFSCAGSEERRAADLWLVEESPRELKVSNIVPAEIGNLSHDEYNALLNEFCDRFVLPSAKATGAVVTLSGQEISIEQWLSKATCRKLRIFSTANRHVWASKIRDDTSWIDFVASAHREGSTLSSSILARWLHEDGGLPEDVAYDLATEYQRARWLLATYDRQECEHAS
jgi:hypothetical protein